MSEEPKPRFAVGDILTVVYPEYGDLKRKYTIKEVRVYKASGIYYLYETAPGHLRYVPESQIDDQKCTNKSHPWS